MKCSGEYRSTASLHWFLFCFVISCCIAWHYGVTFTLHYRKLWHKIDKNHSRILLPNSLHVCFLIAYTQSDQKQKKFTRKRSHTLTCFWEAFSFNYGAHVVLHCFNNHLYCLPLLPSTVVFQQALVLMMLDFESCAMLFCSTLQTCSMRLGSGFCSGQNVYLTKLLESHPTWYAAKDSVFIQHKYLCNVTCNLSNGRFPSVFFTIAGTYTAALWLQWGLPAQWDGKSAKLEQLTDGHYCSFVSVSFFNLSKPLWSCMPWLYVFFPFKAR